MSDEIGKRKQKCPLLAYLFASRQHCTRDPSQCNKENEWHRVWKLGNKIATI